MPKKGFTLIEILVVIAIVGILSSVVVVNLQNSKDKASKAVVLDTLARVQRAATICLEDGQELNCSGYRCNSRLNYPPVAGQRICNGSSDVWPTFDDPDIEWYLANSTILASKEFCFEIAWYDYNLMYMDGGYYSEQYHCTDQGCSQVRSLGSACALASSCGLAGTVCTDSSDCCGGMNCSGGLCTEVFPW